MDMREDHRLRRITHHMVILQLHIRRLPIMGHPLTLAIQGLFLVLQLVVTQCNTLGVQIPMRNRRHKVRCINQDSNGQERNHHPVKTCPLTKVK